MKSLFKTFSNPQFALLTLAGLVSSGYMSLQLGVPVASAVRSQQPNTRIAVASSPSSSPDVLGSAVARVAQFFGVATDVTSAPATKSVKTLEYVQAHGSGSVPAPTLAPVLVSNKTQDVVLGTSDTSTDVQLTSNGAASSSLTAVNVVRNSSFEEASDGTPRQWQYQLDSTSGNTFTTAEAIRTGGMGLKFLGGGTGNFGISQPGAKTIERRAYVLSMWVKPVNTDSHTVKISFWDEVNNKEARSKTFTFSGTKEWSRITFAVDNRNTWNGKKWFPMILVNGLGQGSLYIDDIQLEEANSYTLYHIDGGGSVQAFVSQLGDGSVEVDAHGNIYPAVSGIGSLGTGSNKFEQLVLSKASITKDGDLNLDGSMVVNGNSTLKGTVSFSARLASNLLPDLDDTYTLGSSAYRWNLVKIGTGTSSFAGTVNIGDGGVTNYAQFNNTGDLRLFGTANNIQANNDLVLRSGGSMTLDTSASNTNVVVNAGTGNVNIAANTTNIGDGGTTNYASFSSTGDLTFNGTANNLIGANDLVLRSTNSLTLDTSGSNAGMNFNTGTGTLTQTLGALSTTAQNDAVNAIALSASRGGIQLSTSAASSNGVLYLKSAGTLVLDTSAKNSTIAVQAGTGAFTVGAGASTHTYSGNYLLTDTGQVGLTSNQNAINAIALLTTNGGIDLSTSGLGGLGELRLRSGGSLKLDTSGNNNNILIDSGTGDLLTNIGTNTLVAQDDVVNAVNLQASRGGIQLSTSAASSNGVLYLKSAGTLQLDTSAKNADILVRTGTGTVDISTGLGLMRAQNDNVGAIRLIADRGGIEISSGKAGGNGNVTIKSGGTLSLDTSTTNSNIMVRAGTGRIDLSGNTIMINSGAGTMDLSSNGAINIVSSTTAKLWGEAGTTIGRAGQVTTAYGRLCVQGSDGGTACPAGSDGRLFVQVTGEVSDDPGDVFDVAEYYPASEAVDAGTVVVADASAKATVKKSNYPYQKVLGVVSTSPAVMINEGSFEVGAGTRNTNATKPLIALVGRVPVKVTNENGAIRVGDRLVASSTAGYAMKATKQGLTLGMAVQDMDFTDGVTEGKVMTFVNVSWYFPEVMAAIEQEHQMAAALGTAPDVNKALVLAASTTTSVEPSSTTTNDQTVTASVLGATTDASATTELAVAVPPTEFPNIAVTQALTVGKSLIVAGTSRFEGEVTVVADATFQKSIVVVGDVRIGGNLEVAGAVVTNLTAGTALAAGDPVAVAGDGSAIRASGSRPVVGIAASNAVAGETVKVAVAGKVGGLSGLTAGSRYYMDEAGSLTTDGKGAQSVGVAVSATEMLVQPGVGLPSVVSPVSETPVAPKENPVVDPATTPSVPTSTPTSSVTVAPESTVAPTVVPTSAPEAVTPTPTVTPAI